MPQRTGLGRGLDALIPKEATAPKPGLAMVSVGDIEPNPRQPRRRFEEEALEGLAASIREVGVLQPLLVREGEDGYVLIAGERRLRAAKAAGLTEVPVLVRQANDESPLTEALIENVQRQDLNPLEEAGAYQQLLEDFGMTHQGVGDRVGKSRAAVTNTLRLLSLPASVQGLVERGELSAGAARALAGVEDHKFVEHIGRKAAGEGWSVRQVEEAVRTRKADTDSKPAVKYTEIRPAAIMQLEERLSERLGTAVTIQYKGDKGKVVIKFASVEDLERIYKIFYG